MVIRTVARSARLAWASDFAELLAARFLPQKSTS
jgi:hypothetical protein